MQMIFSSFVLPRDLKALWKKAARAEHLSASEFLRRCLREGVTKTASAKDEGRKGEPQSEFVRRVIKQEATQAIDQR